MPLEKPLTKGQIEAMKNEFMELDVDGDGTISIEELGKILRSQRTQLKVPESEIKRVLREIDQDGDGTINLKEYYLNRINKSNKHLIYRALVKRSTARKQFSKFD